MSIFKGLLQDEDFLIAAGLLQQGAQGKGVGEGLFASISQAGQLKKLFGTKDQKLISAFNKTTGEKEFATSSQIQASNGNLIPYTKPEKEKDKYEIVTREEIENNPELDNNSNYQRNLTTGRIELIKTTKSDAPNITNVTNVDTGTKMESAFGKGIGEGQAKVFNNILENADKAMNENIDLELLTQTAENLETGKVAPIVADLMKWGKGFGLDVSWLSNYGDMNSQIQNTEVISVLAGNQLFGKISQTKGAISEKEMDIFESLTTSLSMTPDGIKANARIMEAINDREILKANMAEEWVAGDDGELNTLLTKKEVNGKMMTFNQMWDQYTNAKDENGDLVNPIIPKEERDNMLNLANTNLEEMKNNDNFIQANGQWYYIIDEEKKIYKKINSL
jgi:hypothetical protein